MSQPKKASGLSSSSPLFAVFMVTVSSAAVSSLLDVCD